MKLLEKAVNILLIICCIFILTGCSSEKEVRERAFVQAAAVSENRDNTVSVAVKVFEDDKTYNGKGKDFFEAVENAELEQDKHFFTGHMEFIISSSENSMSLLEEILKENKISPSCTVMYNADACKFIENTDCDELYGIIKIRSEKGNAYNKSILTALKELTDNGKCVVDGIDRTGEIFSAELKGNS